MNKEIKQLQSTVDYWEDKVFAHTCADGMCFSNGSIYPIRKELDGARFALNLAQQNMVAAMSALDGEEITNEQRN